MNQITYTEEELADLLHCSKRKVSELRHACYINAIKVGKEYVYHIKEIERFFEKYGGRNL